MTHAEPWERKVGIIGTGAIHLLVVAACVLAAKLHHTERLTTYELNLVAAPLPAPEVRRAPTEALPTRTPETVPVAKPKIEPKRTPPPPPPPAPAKVPEVARPPVTHAPVVPVPGAVPSTGSDVISLQRQGIEFPYPAYLHQIVNAIYQRWNNTGFRPGFDTRIDFTILQDGTVPTETITIVKRSGNTRYDDMARAAIETASSQRAFGPLPPGFTGSLPITFDFVQGKGTP